MRRPLGINSRFFLSAVVSLSLALTSPASAGLWGGNEKVDMSFHEVFPRPFYETSNFGWALLVVTIAGAGVVTYFSAGAGAPTAATGVSTVASWIGGGGAGSYMAGLSTVGSWVGGNAMVGSAILNGVSLGLGGGGAAFGTLSAVGKVGFMASVSATALDGILIYKPQDSQRIRYEIRLAVPEDIGSDNIEDLAEEVVKTEKEYLKAAADQDKAAWDSAKNRRAALTERVKAEGLAALKVPATPSDLLVLGVLNKTLGNSHVGDQLIQRIPTDRLSDAGYLNYLKAVIALEHSKTSLAEQFLRKSVASNPYAIEPVLLLVNLLGEKGFAKNEGEIERLVQEAGENYDRDEYDTGYGMLALNYRAATLHFNAGGNEYDEAQRWYEEAYDSIAFMQERFGVKRVRNMVRLGIANSLYMQGRKAEAQKLMGEIMNDTSSYLEKSSLSEQFCGNRKCMK